MLRCGAQAILHVQHSCRIAFAGGEVSACNTDGSSPWSTVSSTLRQRYQFRILRLLFLLVLPLPQTVMFDTGHLRTNLRDARVFFCF